MTRRGPWKRVSRDEWSGRLANARAFLKAASDLLALAEVDANGNPMIVHAVNAAIAFADALTIRYASIQNAQDHGAVMQALKMALGGRADVQQLNRLGRILSYKDDAQYGHRMASLAEAEAVVQQVRRFSEWVEAELMRP